MNSRWGPMLLRIGDRCPEYGGSNDFKEHIDICHAVLWHDFKNSKNQIMELILQCVNQLPHKIPFYGVLIGLINLEDENLVKEFVNDSHSNLQDALLDGNCNSIRILFRFIAVLMCSKVLLSSSVVEAFETLLSSAATTIDEESGNPSWQPRADFYVNCILSSLPWCGLELFEQAPDDLDRIMVGIQSYLSIRKHTSDHACSVFMLNEEKNHEEKDFLEDLWDRIQILSNSGWKADSVPKPHLSFEVQLINGPSHDFPPINCPGQPHKLSTNSDISILKTEHEAKLAFPRRLCRLHIFPAEKVENLQPIDCYVVEEYLLDVLFFFNGCRKECASYMVGLPVPFRYEYLMAETIFSQLLLLPQPPFRPFYYSLVIIDLCKALPGAFPAVIAGAVCALFDRIAELDMECRFRLILWFTQHISNFQFIWLWDEWDHVINLPKWAPQRVFVQEVLEKEVRLSYWDKIKKSIENAPLLDKLMPPKVGSCFKFGTDDCNEKAEGHIFSAELSSMVKGRKTARDVTSWVEKSIITMHGFDFALVVVTQTLLNIGSKSFTHLTTLLERYGQVIGKLCPDHEKQGLLIQEVSSYWKNSTQMTAITIDRMMSYRLVSSLVIVDWVFSSANVDQFHLKDLAWEVLRNAINKTTNLMSDMRKDILSLEKSIITAKDSEEKYRADLEDAESKLMDVNGESVKSENPGRLKRLKTFLEKARNELTSLNESLEAKEALLARAVDENKALFLSLFRNFSIVLSQRLSGAEMLTVESEEPASMETDQDNDKPTEGEGNDESKAVKTVKYDISEREQWCRSTLGYAKAFSRQCAAQILPHMELLDAEIFTGDVHPLFLKTVYGGLGRAES